MDGCVIIDGVAVYGQTIALPVVPGVAPSSAPPEFAPAPTAPSPIAPLQPHPAYPPSYPPASLASGIMETGPRKVPVDLDPSHYIFKENGSSGVPSGDMLQNEFATNGIWGVVDWAQRADIASSVPWGGLTNVPSHIGTYWFVGAGPPPTPPADIPGAGPGDLYLDSLTGNIYQRSIGA